VFIFKTITSKLSHFDCAPRLFFSLLFISMSMFTLLWFSCPDLVLSYRYEALSSQTITTAPPFSGKLPAFPLKIPVFGVFLLCFV
jgi:hypothetical protein